MSFVWFLPLVNGSGSFKIFPSKFVLVDPLKIYTCHQLVLTCILIPMKKAADPRHQLRRQIVKSLFAEGFTHQSRLAENVTDILKVKDSLDDKIQKAAPAWPIDKLNRIDLAILRLAVYELTTSGTPPKVIIDEAVELAKEFGSESSSSFVNGVLGTIFKEKEEKNESEKS